ncbi:alpha/beta fold hydrolase [Nevskia soli]|uniref:alpha/beta fold hydrolase n=1 Tax=Nevskia soli TaxID=418856 RepID=UPI0004A776D7|nr:alpha/beta hydrolase [Nevskia soli]
MSTNAKQAVVNGASLLYRDSGPADGATVILSHSLFFDHTMFDPLSGLLCANGYHVIAYDHRGQGGSSVAPRDLQSVDQLAEDAAALINHLGLGPVHFAGNSLGGFVALRLAARRPELLLTATALGSSAEEEYSLEAFTPLVEHLLAHGAAGLVEPIMHIMFGDVSLSRGGALTDHWRAKIAALGRQIGDSAHQVIHRKRIVEELHGCRVPVLAISGAEDHAYPAPLSDLNIAQATDGASARVKEAGHSVSLERPEEVARLLMRHFSSVKT